jgi:enoyl-CoA hydratase/carnithine racemase
MEERLKAPRAERMALAGGELLVEVVDGVATVTLNRPRVLNALSHAMIEGLTECLDAWEHDRAVQSIVLRGAGEKAFCAGGDLREVRERMLARDPELLHFFEREYALDLRIHEYPKPITADIDGIVMGGGMGISQGARTRIVGERTRMAMPETAIGLFPDVGGSYFLSRVPGKIGVYLALVGPSIDAADALYCGLADTHTSRRAGASELETLRPAIDEHFAQPSVESIVASLRREERPACRDWATQTLEKLGRNSPTMLKVTLEQLRRGATMPLAGCFRMELGMVRAAIVQGDFAEGIRALIIDKDNTPRWNPDRLEAVTPAMVERFFQEARP